MDAWHDWQLGRLVLLLAAVMYVGMWTQLTLLHWNARFRLGAMLWPVLFTPVVIAFTFVAVGIREGWLGWLVLVLLAMSVMLGMVGLFFHLRGVHRRFGGFSLRNLAGNLPPVLPLAYALNGVLGLLALTWDSGLY